MFMFLAMEEKKLLNPLVISLLFTTSSPSILKQDLILHFYLPLSSLIKAHLFLHISFSTVKPFIIVHSFCVLNHSFQFFTIHLVDIIKLRAAKFISFSDTFVPLCIYR